MVKIVAKTDIGLKRTSNQDSYAAGELPGSVAWAVVCDGMGGTNGGNFASSTAVKIISDKLKNYIARHCQKQQSYKQISDHLFSLSLHIILRYF